MAKIRGIWEPASVVAVAICLLTIAGYAAFWAWSQLQPEEPAFAPVRILNLEVEPNVVAAGETATLIDGICNDSNDAISVEIYLGAQAAGPASIFTGLTVDLLRHPITGQTVRDTPEGRRRMILEPGCTAAEPITTTVPAALTPGIWILKARVIAHGPAGEVQDIIRTSGPFEIRGGME